MLLERKEMPSMLTDVANETPAVESSPPIMIDEVTRLVEPVMQTPHAVVPEEVTIIEPPKLIVSEAKVVAVADETHTPVALPGALIMTDPADNTMAAMPVVEPVRRAPNATVPPEVTVKRELMTTSEFATAPARCTPNPVFDARDPMLPPEKDIAAEERVFVTCMMYVAVPSAEKLDAEKFAESVDTGALNSKTLLSVQPVLENVAPSDVIVPDESTAPAKLTETAVAPIVESTPEKLNVLDDSETGPEVSRPKADPLEDDATVPAKLTESEFMGEAEPDEMHTAALSPAALMLNVGAESSIVAASTEPPGRSITPSAVAPPPAAVTVVADLMTTFEFVTAPARCTPNPMVDEAKDVRLPPEKEITAEASVLVTCMM